MLQRIDHVNVRTANLDAMIAWYEDVLEMKAGWRPNFPFPGAWLYIGDLAVVHLVAEDEPPLSQDPQIEHYAFKASGYAAFMNRIHARGLDCQTNKLEDAGICQVNIFDPDNNHIHVDFDLAEVP